MSETSSRNPAPSGAPEEPRGLADVVKQEIADTAEDLRAAARDLRNAAFTAAGTVKSTAADLAGVAGDKARGVVEEQLNYAADRVGGLAQAAHKAADELEGELPLAADYVRRAGAGIEGLSNVLRQQDMADLLDGVERFAARRPATAFVASALVGFAVARFLKSSAEAGS